jgi:hypothetical protein
MDLYHLRQGLHVIASSWDYHGGAESRVSVRGNPGRFSQSVAYDSTYLVADATGHAMDFVGLREQVCSGNAAALEQAEARGRPDEGGHSCPPLSYM